MGRFRFVFKFQTTFVANLDVRTGFDVAKDMCGIKCLDTYFQAHAVAAF